MKRKLVTLLLLAALLLSLVPGTALAADGVSLTAGEDAWDGDGLTVTLNAPQALTADLFAATYVNGQMTQVKSVSGVSGGETVTFDLDPAYRARVFALTPGAGKPLCPGLEVENEAVVLRSTRDLVLPTMEDDIAAAVSAAVSAYASASLALSRTEDAVTAQLAAAGQEGDGGQGFPSPYLAPALSFPRRPDLAETFPVAVSAGERKAVRDAAAAYAAASAASAGTAGTWGQITRACAVLEAVARAEADRAGEGAVSLLSVSQEDQLAWARAITAQYDAYQGSRRLAQLARDMGVDARRAYNTLVMAQNILKGHYAKTEGDLNEFWEKAMIYTKASAKVGLVVCATVLSGGATAASPAGYLSLGEAAGILVGSADATLEVTSAGAKIILGSDHTVVKKLEATTKPLSDACLLFGLFTGGGSSPGEILAFLGDLEARKKELYDNIRLKYDKDLKRVLADILTIDPYDRDAVHKLLEKYGGDGKTGFEPPDKTAEEVVEDFTRDRPADDETLREILDRADLEGDPKLSEVVRDFEEELDREMEGEPDPDPADENYVPIPRPDRFWHWYDSETDRLLQEGCRDGEGNDLWVRYYNKDTGLLSDEAVFTDAEDGHRVRTWTHFFNEAGDEAAWGRVHWTQVYLSDDRGRFETPYYGDGPWLTFDRNGMLVERRDAGCTEVYTGDGVLSMLTYYEKSGTVSTTTTYSYYTYQPGSLPFDPTGHLQYVKVTQKDSDYFPPRERTLLWEEWETGSWRDGDDMVYGYYDTRNIPNGDRTREEVTRVRTGS